MSHDVTVPETLSQTNRSPLRTRGAEGRLTPIESYTFLLAKLSFAEFLVVASAAYITSLLYYTVALGHLPDWESYGLSAILIASLVTLVSLGFRHYVALRTQPRHRFLWSGLGAVALAFSFFLSTLFLLKATEDYSRATFFFQFFSVAIAVLSVRTLGWSTIRSAIASGRVAARRVVVIGNRGNYADIDDKLNDAAIQCVRFLPFPSKARSHSTDVDHSVTHQLIATCRKLRPDDIVILANAAELARSASLADALSELPVSVHVIPTDSRELLGSAQLGDLGSLVTIQLLQAPLSPFDLLIKRVFDVGAAIAGLLFLSPLLLITSIAIKLDSKGPVFFRQTRHGYNNESIRVLKFRTMTTMEDGQAFRQATKNDARVTRFGRILRRTNIDELPQLVNVLLGEMSIVGPRPHPIALNDAFQKHISPLSRRHKVKPGITGWAQVNGHRGETDTLEKMQRRFEADLYYIDNWSFLLDAKIILMTLFSKQAYINAY
jgi:Undecaprenyl-phosphate glucose phosphotransferase